MAIIFSSSWDSAPLGCSLAAYTDNFAWDDASDQGEVCVSPPWVQIASPGFGGGRYFHKRWNVGDPVGDGGGPEVVVSKNAPPGTSELWFAWYQRWSDGFYFHADLKNLIVGGAIGLQEIYINTQPDGGSGGPGLIAVLQVTEDRFIRSTNVSINGDDDTWHLIEVHVRFSSSGDGLLEMRYDGVEVEWDEPSWASNFTTADDEITTYKLSSYYNGFGDSEPQDALPFSYDIDEFRVDDETWVGGEIPEGGSGGSGGSPGGGGSSGSSGSPGGGGGGTGVLASVYSDIDCQCPGSWYGGFKEARVTQWGIAERTLSDPYTGAWSGATFDFETADHDRSQRIIAQNEPWRLKRTRCVRMTNRPNRAALGIPYVIWIGPTIDAQPAGKLGFRYTLADRVAASVVSDKHQVPWRLMRDGFLDQLDEVASTFDLDQPEPQIYGHHLRVPDVDAPVGAGFEITPPLLGTRTIVGTQYYVWLIAGHAVYDVPRIRIETFTGSPPVREMVETAEGDEWLIPTHANHAGVFGASYEDLLSSTFGVTRRYTLLYGVVGDGTTAPDEVARGDRALTVAVTGVETNGDGTGTPIIARHEQYKHWLINYVANRAENSYQSGAWLDNPTYNDPFDGNRPIVDEDSFDQCTAIAQERFPGDGYQGSAVIGARAGDRRGAPDWMAVWNRSCGGRFGTTHVGAMRYVMLHPTDAIRAAAPLYTDATEIGLDSFSCSFAWNEHANLIPFRTDYEHISGQWKTNGVYPHDESIAAYGVAIPSALREYQFAPGITPSTHLAILEARVRANPPRLVGLETTVGPDEDGDSLGYRDLGDYIRYRHFASVGDTIGEIRLAWIIAHQVQVQTRTVRVVALDCEDLIGFDEPDDAGSSGSGGSP